LDAGTIEVDVVVADDPDGFVVVGPSDDFVDDEHAVTRRAVTMTVTAT
jgi:hypothetical protein